MHWKGLQKIALTDIGRRSVRQSSIQEGKIVLVDPIEEGVVDPAFDDFYSQVFFYSSITLPTKGFTAGPLCKGL